MMKLVFKYNIKSRRVKRVVVISNGLLNDLVLELQLEDYKHKIFIAHDGANPVAEEKLHSAEENRTTLKVGYAGGLRKGNGITLILELAQRLPGCQFHLAGGTDKELQYWKSLANHKNVVWHGRLSPSKVEAFLKGCDLLLAPYQLGPKTAGGQDTSRWMSPLKVFEYMASGRAMLVSDFPVLREVLDESFSFILKPDNISEWENAIKFCQDNSEARIDLGKRAQKELNSYYTWHKRAEKVLHNVELTGES